MEKHKTIWFSVPVSTLIQAAEEKSDIKIELSYDELMEQVLDEKISTSSIAANITANKVIENLFGQGNHPDESLVFIKGRFSHSVLKELIENKSGYSDSVSWKDALHLVLDHNRWSLTVPAVVEEQAQEVAA